MDKTDHTKHGEIVLSGEDAAEAALDAHYPVWDTLNREESNLPERILPFGPYRLMDLPLKALPEESPYEINEEIIKNLMERPQGWPPIIAPFSENEEVADGWHRIEAARRLGASHIPAWVSRNYKP